MSLANNGEHMKYANSDEFVERMKCFRKKTSGETIDDRVKHVNEVFLQKIPKVSTHFSIIFL